ncbi:MAG: hypothetical protein ACREOZ_02470, partial [Gloeomargaritales cyanobacterium]
DSTCLSSESASTINTTVTNKSNSSWLASCRNDSSEDATLARHSTSHVIRNTIGEQASEQSQHLIIRDFAELCQICSPSPSSSSEGMDPGPKIPAMSDKSCVSKNQVQVALIEVSHLVTALGEASSTTLEYLVGPLSGCVRHSSPGVRLEAAAVYAAIAARIPSAVGRLMDHSLEKVEASWTNIIKLATFESNPTASEAKRRFRRNKSTDVLQAP